MVSSICKGSQENYRGIMKKKKLDTLVDDIYSKLSVLGEGKQLDVSEKDIDELGESIKTALKHWAHPEPRNSTETLRMSNIGRPERQLWYDLNSEDSDTPIAPQTFIKFLYGHILEEVVLFLVRLAGHKVDDEQKKVSVSGVKGHMDCTIDGEVVDVKTASGYAFKKFRDGTLAEQDTFGYMSQLASYEEGEYNYIKSVHKGVVKVMSKMGISTVASYTGSQIFEIVGIDTETTNTYFPGTVSRGSFNKQLRN